MDERQVPIGVKIIALILYVCVAVMALGVVNTIVDIVRGYAGDWLGIAIIAAVAGLFLTIGLFLIARGIWTGQQWARITVIVLTSLTLIFGVLQLVIFMFTSERVVDVSQGIIAGIASLVIIALLAYFVFNDKVKTAFKE